MKTITGISFDPFCPYPNSGGTITVLYYIDTKHKKRKGRMLANLKCENGSKQKDVENRNYYCRNKRGACRTLPPTLIPSVIKYNAGGGFGAAWAENKPLGLSTNSRFRSLPGGDPTLNSYGWLKDEELCVSCTFLCQNQPTDQQKV